MLHTGVRATSRRRGMPGARGARGRRDIRRRVAAAAGVVRSPHHLGGRDHSAGAQQEAPPLDGVAPLGLRVAAGACALLDGVGGVGFEPVRAGVGGVVAAAGVARSPHHLGGRDHPAGAQQEAPPFDGVAPLCERVAAGAYALLGGVGGAD